MNRKLIIIDHANVMFKSIFAFRNNPQIPVTYLYLSQITGYLKKIGVTLEDKILVGVDYGSWRKDYDPCLTGDTEILTEDGWKFIKDIVETKQKIKIATLNKEKNIVEYNYPNKFYKYNYSGILYHLGGQTSSRIDLLTTPEHQNYIANKTTKRFGLLKSKNLLNYPYLFYRGFNYNGNKPLIDYIIPYLKTENTCIRPKNVKQTTIFEYPERKIKMNDWLKLFGWYITEGCIGSRFQRDVINKITISQSESHNIKYVKNIRNILTKLNIHWNETKRKNNIISFDISDTQLATFLAKYGKSHYKYIDRYLLNNLSKRQCGLLLKYMLKGDGHKRGFNKYVYTTSSEQLANDVQELALKSGFTATMSKKYKNNKTNSEFYFVYIHKIPIVEASKREITYWNGDTYDIEVNNHLFYVRRNGKCCWTGNCYKAQRKALREGQEDKDFWDEMFKEFNELVIKLDSCLSWHFPKIYKCEFDDIASCAVRYLNDYNEKIIISTDEDLQQLCTLPNVKVFSPYSKKYKLIKNPEKILLKKIRGDVSDNLLTVPKTEAEFTLRKMIVNLLELPLFVEQLIRPVLENLPIKNMYLNKIPFRSIRTKIAQLYKLEE